MKKTKTYMDKLMKNKEFREKFDEEYKNICIGEQIAGIRHRANLTQDALAKRTHTTKSAISAWWLSLKLPAIELKAKFGRTAKCWKK